MTIGILGLGLRLAYVLEFVGHPLGRMTWVDEWAYWERAQEIVAGHWLPSRPFYQDPLLPYGLALLTRLVGADVSRIRIALACLGGLTPLAIYWTGRIGLGRLEGIVAGLAAAVYGPLIFTDGQIEKEGLGALVAALALGLTARLATRGPSVGGSAGAGFAWGLLLLLRSNALVIAPLGAAWTASLALRDASRTPAGRRVAHAMGFLLGFGLPVLPVAAVNAYVGRPPEFLLTTGQLGANFYIGNGPEATGVYANPPFVTPHPAREADDFAAEAYRRSGRALTTGQVSRFWFGEGLRQWQEAPGASMALLGHKLALLGHDFEVPDNMSEELVRVAAAPALALGILSFGWITPWAALGLGRSSRTPFWWMLVLSTAAGLASTAVFFVVGRYRIPWIPGVLLLAAAGLVDLARRLRDRQWRATAWRIALLFVPATVLAWRPMNDPAPQLWGHALLTLAVANLDEGLLEVAIDAFDDARAFGPEAATLIDRSLANGPVCARLVELINLQFQQERPASAEATLNRARWLRQIPGGRAESRRLLHEILEADPVNLRAIRERGAWWLGALDVPDSRIRAADDFARATRSPSPESAAAIMLALVSRNPRYLPLQDATRHNPLSARARLARAILVQR